MIRNRDIICFSFSDWGQEMVSNRYHMMTRFARHNRVFFFELPSRTPKFWPIRKKDNLYLVGLPNSPNPIIQRATYRFYLQRIYTYFQIRQPIFWFYNYQLSYLIDEFSPLLSCYHCTEDYAGLALINNNSAEAVKSVVNQEKNLVKKVDLVFSVSRQLVQKQRTINPHTYLAANAVDYDFYQTAQNPPQRKFGVRPIIGYAGNLSIIVDFQILDYLAQNLPRATLILAGPVSAENQYLERLRRRPNVKFLGKLPVEDLPVLYREFDICLIPYIQDQWFRQTAQPLKLLEYFASGKPVVSTPMDCLAPLHKLVYIGVTQEEYLRQIKIALKEKNPILCQKRMTLAQKNTWDKRFAFINRKMRGALAKKDKNA